MGTDLRGYEDSINKIEMYRDIHCTPQQRKEFDDMISRTVNASRFPASGDRQGWAEYYCERNPQLCFWYLLLIEMEL